MTEGSDAPASVAAKLAYLVYWALVYFGAITLLHWVFGGVL